MENVVSLDDRRAPASAQPMVCRDCGGQWFELRLDEGPGAVTLNLEGSVTGYAGKVVCRDCGTTQQ